MEKQKSEGKKKKSHVVAPKLDENTPTEPILSYGKNRPEDGRPLGEKVNLKTAVLVFSILILIALAFRYRNLFIAATVDGKPVFRFEVIKELEKQGGKQTLDSIITKKLIEKEAENKAIVVTDEEVNAEIETIDNSIRGQGSTLEKELANQGMTIERLKIEVDFQKKVEKILSQRVSVTEEDIDNYIESNKENVPEGVNTEELRVQIKEQLIKQKMSFEYQDWVNGLKENAKINTFVKY